MKRARYATSLVVSMVVLMAMGPFFTTVAYAATPRIPSSVVLAVSYADTEGRGNQSGNCDTCFPSPWCGSPGIQFIGSSTNYNGNSTDANNCRAGDWDTGAILVMNTGTSPVTFTNLTVAFPLPSSGNSSGDTVIPTCKAEERPITFNVWFGQQYYWHNLGDPAFNGGPITVPAGGEAIFAGTSSDNSYHCPTGNYPSTGTINGTYDFDTSDAYYLGGCTPTTDPSSAPRIVFSANGYSTTTYNDTGHTLDTGGIDTGNCTPTQSDPQWGHENLGWRLIGTCGEGCPTNQPLVASTTTISTTGGSQSTTVIGTTEASGGNSTVVYGVAVVVVVVLAAAIYVVTRKRVP